MLFKVSVCHHAHQEQMESSDLGVRPPADVLKCFDEFDWTHEISEAIELGRSATLSVEDATSPRLIWVGGYGDPKFPTFVSECSFPGMKKRLFGFLGEGMGVVELHTQEFDLRQARRAIELFVSNDDAGLRELYESP